MESIICKKTKISIGDTFIIDGCEENGIVKEFSKTGYWEENERYNLLISWEDNPEELVTTPASYAIDNFIIKYNSKDA